jgi:hypothetical protein
MNCTFRLELIFRAELFFEQIFFWAKLFLEQNYFFEKAIFEQKIFFEQSYFSDKIRSVKAGRLICNAHAKWLDAF